MGLGNDFFEMIRQMYGVSRLHGYTEEEIAFLKQKYGKIPEVLEEYYRTAGKTEAFHHTQDMWILPEHLRKWKAFAECEDMILLNENQGVCQAAILREDFGKADPPVYVSEDGGDGEMSAPSVSEFLAAALAYEAVFACEYTSEEFYWITEKESELLESRLEKYPFRMENWISGMAVTLYHNAPDNLVAVMEMEDGERQMLYGAVSEESYEKLLAAVAEIGEPV